jgi:hypothetical protein
MRVIGAGAPWCGGGGLQTVAAPLAAMTVRRWPEVGFQQVVMGRFLAEWFARLASAGDDDAYGRRFPHWGLHHGASPSSCLLDFIPWPLDFWFVAVCGSTV